MFSYKTIQHAVRIAPFDARAAQNKMAPHPRTMVRPPELPGQPHIGAVLLLLYCKNKETHIVLIRRQETLKYHPGQISFPGGRREKNESLRETALREAVEEIGVDRNDLIVLGELESVYIPPSDFIVHPFVAWHKTVPVFTHDTTEVAEVFEVPLANLCGPDSRGTEQRSIGERQITVPYFIVGGYKAWGATAMIMNELLERLQAAVSGLR